MSQNENSHVSRSPGWTRCFQSTSRCLVSQDSCTENHSSGKERIEGFCLSPVAFYISIRTFHISVSNSKNLFWAVIPVFLWYTFDFLITQKTVCYPSAEPYTPYSFPGKPPRGHHTGLAAWWRNFKAQRHIRGESESYSYIKCKSEQMGRLHRERENGTASILNGTQF